MLRNCIVLLPTYFTDLNLNNTLFTRMKLTLKTLSRDTFNVEIDENLKVSDLKKKVEEVRGPSHPAQNLKLIYAGSNSDLAGLRYDS